MSQPLGPEDEDVIVYEVYHVRDYDLFVLPILMVFLPLEYLEHPWVQRISS